MTATIAPTLVPAEEARIAMASLSSELAGGAADLEPLLERFLVSILPLAGAQAGAVRVLGDDGQTMRLVAQSGLPEQVQSAERLMQRDCGMCGVAAGADVLGWVDDVRACAQHSKVLQVF